MSDEPLVPGRLAPPRALASSRALTPPPLETVVGTLPTWWQRLDVVPRTGLARLAFPIAVAIASRAYSLILLALASIAQPELAVPRLSGYRDLLLQWDGQWYVMIANTGYHAAPMQPGPFGGRHDFAFFPGWPTVLRAFHAIGIQPADVAVPLANVLFVVAAVLMFLVLERALGSVAARWGLVLLAFSPAAYVLSLAYSEPLFLLLVAASFLFTNSRIRPIAAAAAMFTRITGVGLAVGAGLTWLRNRRDWISLATAITVAVAFAGWWTFIWALTGDPLGWFQGSAKWANDLGLPAIGDALTGAQPGFLAVVYVTLMFGASLLLIRRNRELGAYAAIAIGLSMLGAPVSSMPRHVLVAFPAFGLLADRLGPRRSILLAIVFALFEANAVWLAFVGNSPLAP